MRTCILTFTQSKRDGVGFILTFTQSKRGRLGFLCGHVFSPLHTLSGLELDFNADMYSHLTQSKRGWVGSILTFTYSKRGGLNFNADMYSHLYTE